MENEAERSTPSLSVCISLSLNFFFQRGIGTVNSGGGTNLRKSILFFFVDDVVVGVGAVDVVDVGCWLVGWLVGYSNDFFSLYSHPLSPLQKMSSLMKRRHEREDAVEGMSAKILGKVEDDPSPNQ